jgi:hypothetical protein
MQSEANDLDYPFQGRIPSSPVLYFSWTQQKWILQFQNHLAAEKPLSTLSNRCQKTQQWVLCSEAQEYLVVISTKYKHLYGWTDCVDGFIWVVKQTNKIHIVPIGTVGELGHLVREKGTSGGIDSVWLVNNHVDLDTYWTVY